MLLDSKCQFSHSKAHPTNRPPLHHQICIQQHISPSTIWSCSVPLCVCVSVPTPPPPSTRPSDRVQIWHAYADWSRNHSNLNIVLNNPTPRGARREFTRSKIQKSGKCHAWTVQKINNNFPHPTLGFFFYGSTFQKSGKLTAEKIDAFLTPTPPPPSPPLSRCWEALGSTFKSLSIKY